MRVIIDFLNRNSRIAPPVFRGTVGLIAVGTRRYIDWFAALERYIQLLPSSSELLIDV